VALSAVRSRVAGSVFAVAESAVVVLPAGLFLFNGRSLVGSQVSSVSVALSANVGVELVGAGVCDVLSGCAVKVSLRLNDLVYMGDADVLVYGRKRLVESASVVRRVVDGECDSAATKVVLVDFIAAAVTSGGDGTVLLRDFSGVGPWSVGGCVHLSPGSVVAVGGPYGLAVNAGSGGLSSCESGGVFDANEFLEESVADSYSYDCYYSDDGCCGEVLLPSRVRA